MTGLTSGQERSQDAMTPATHGCSTLSWVAPRPTQKGSQEGRCPPSQATSFPDRRTHQDGLGRTEWLTEHRQGHLSVENILIHLHAPHDVHVHLGIVVRTAAGRARKGGQAVKRHATVTADELRGATVGQVSPATAITASATAHHGASTRPASSRSSSTPKGQVLRSQLLENLGDLSALLGSPRERRGIPAWSLLNLQTLSLTSSERCLRGSAERL